MEDLVEPVGEMLSDSVGLTYASMGIRISGQVSAFLFAPFSNAPRVKQEAIVRVFVWGSISGLFYSKL